MKAMSPFLALRVIRGFGAVQHFSRFWSEADVA